MLSIRQYVICVVTTLIPVLVAAQPTTFQPGYIVRATSSDTIRGYVDAFHATRKKGVVHFRQNAHESATEQVYTASQVAAVGSGTQEVYVSRAIPINGSLQPRFLRLVVQGDASLFKTHAEEQAAEYFLERTPTQTMPLLRNQQLQVLQTTLVGCPSLAFTNTAANRRYYAYKLDDFRRAVRQFNQCQPNPQPTREYQEPSPFSVRPGVRVGLQSSRLYYPNERETFQGQKPAAYVSPTAGIFLQLGISPHVSLLPELLYGSTRSTLTTTTRPGASNDFYRMQLDLQASYIRLPLAVRYTLGRMGHRIRPYLEGGYAIGYVFDAQVMYTQTPIGAVVIDQSLRQEYTMERRLQSYFGGAGFTYHATSGVWGLAARFEGSQLNNTYIFSNIYLDNQCLTLTYSWK